MRRAVDIAVVVPIIAGGVVNGIVALAAAAPAMAVAVWRVEHTIAQAKTRAR